MKLSFSTLGCPAWTMEEVINRGAKYGFEGVEIRGFSGEIDLTKLPEFRPSEREGTYRRFAEAGLEICCVDSSARFTSNQPAERMRHVQDAEWHAELAASLRSPYIRVFGGKIPQGVNRDDCVKYMAHALAEAGCRAAKYNVKVLLETHDSFTRGADIAPVLRIAGNDNLGVVWDIRHSVRSGESLEDTWNLVGRQVCHVHVKDETDRGEMCAVGEGDIPVGQCVKLLQKNGFEGYLSLEWEKKWHPEIAAPEEIFPKYVQVMKSYLNKA